MVTAGGVDGAEDGAEGVVGVILGPEELAGVEAAGVVVIVGAAVAEGVVVIDGAAPAAGAELSGAPTGIAQV